MTTLSWWLQPEAANLLERELCTRPALLRSLIAGERYRWPSRGYFEELWLLEQRVAKLVEREEIDTHWLEYVREHRNDFPLQSPLLSDQALTHEQLFEAYLDLEPYQAARLWALRPDRAQEVREMLRARDLHEQLKVWTAEWAEAVERWGLDSI